MRVDNEPYDSMLYVDMGSHPTIDSFADLDASVQTRQARQAAFDPTQGPRPSRVQEEEWKETFK